MMMTGYFKYLTGVLSIVWLASGCSSDNEEGIRDYLKDDCLNIVVRQDAMRGDQTTRSGKELSSTASADTVWLDQEAFITADIRDQVEGENIQTRGTLKNTSNAIKDLNLIAYKTDGLDFKPGESDLDPDPKKAFIKVTNSNGNVTLENKYAWSEGDINKRTFVLVAPPVPNADILKFLDEKKHSLTYEVPQKIEDQPDLCVSDIQRNLNITYPMETKNNIQQFYLKHVLTAVGFEAVGWDLKVTSISIKGMGVKGTLTLYDRTWDVEDPEYPENITRSPKAIDKWLNSATKEEWENITSGDGYMMMMPQTLSDNVILTFKYEGKGEQPKAGTYSVQLNKITPNWESGKKIIYKLRLKTKPAVQDDHIIIQDFRPGYTHKNKVSIIAAEDDDLTFSWSASWLKMHRGTPGAVDVSGGLSSGFKTGVNNWNNLYFFSSSENQSLIAERTATVTVTGKKSGTRTFKVTQIRKGFEIEGAATNLDFREGRAEALSYWLDNGIPLSDCQVSVSVVNAQGPGRGVYDQNWLYSPAKRMSGEGKETVTFSYKWNIQARITRTATVRVTVAFGGIVKSRDFQITQKASQFWIMLHDNGTFRMGIYATNTGRNFGKEEWRCSNGRYGSRMLRTDWREHTAAESWVQFHWVNRANFTRETYWSSTHRSNFWGTGRAEIFHVTMTGFGNYSFAYGGVLLRRWDYAIRCLYDNPNSIY